MLLDDLDDHLPFELESEDVDTIGGWVYSQFNEGIAVGKSLAFEDHLFTITEMDTHRITRVIITKQAPAESTQASTQQEREGALV